MPVNYMPGDSRNLVRAQIKATEGSDTSPIEVYFNPKEITVDKPVNWQKHPGSETDQPALEFTEGQGRALSVELMFDKFEEKGDVYAQYVSRLEHLVMIDGSLKRPPLCVFIWGDKMPEFKGVIENLNVKYTLFLPDGTPCRATVSLKMKESSHLLNKKEGEAAKAREKAEKGATQASDGSTPAKNSDDPKAVRASMDKANVDDPANVPPGTPVPKNPSGGR